MMAHKPDLAIVIGAGKPHHAEPDGDEPTDSGGDDHETDAVAALVDAIHSKDVEGAKEALKTFIELCYGGGDDDGDEGKGY